MRRIRFLKSGGIYLPNSDKVYTVGAIVYIKDNNLVIERANIPTGDKVTEKQSYMRIKCIIWAICTTKMMIRIHLYIILRAINSSKIN